MILGSFRGFDTLGETVVVLLAALGVYAIFKTGVVIKETNNIDNTDNNAYYSSLHNNLISGLDNKTNTISSTFYVLLPLLYLYAFYVQFHGDYGPGGGFQAGVIFAVPYILMTIILGYPVANQYIPIKRLIHLMSIGVMLYLLTGIATILLGGKFLDYYYFGNNFENAYHYGLLSIELGVGITVFCSMSVIIGQFYSMLEEK
jgi:multicomponent Na+:H+ antiporter subunit B